MLYCIQNRKENKNDSNTSGCDIRRTELSKASVNKSNKQHFDRGVFSLVKKSTEKY